MRRGWEGSGVERGEREFRPCVGCVPTAPRSGAFITAPTSFTSCFILLMATRLPDVISSRGETCALWEWTPNHPPKGLVVVFHGLAAHTRFPTVRIAAELLSANGYVVCGLDLPGHGASEGLRGYIYSSQALIDDGLAAYWAACKSHPALPTFLLGSSMGAAIAIGVASSLTAEDATPHGIVMLAPMLAPAASPFLSTLVSALAWTPLSRLALISSSATSNEKQYADPAMRAEIESDELAYKGSLRVASVAAVLELGATTEENLEGIRPSCAVLRSVR